MKWYHWLFVISLLLASCGLLAFWHWWTSPINPHLPPFEPAALPPDYTSYWGIVAAVTAAVYLVPQGIIIYLLYAMYKRG